jgi:hypothetical protein
MFICLFCGDENPSDRAQVCRECGSKWMPSEVDHPEELKKYYQSTKDFYFDPEIDGDTYHKEAIKLRQRLKISHQAHTKILDNFAKKKIGIEELSKFTIEFDENVVDAYAGADTLLRFRFTNSSSVLLKFRVTWDDPDVPDELDFSAKSQNYIKPGQSTVLSSTHIFSRFGPKGINDLEILVSDSAQDNARFIASPFRFTVLNPDQKVVNNISTTTNLSVEGSGVIQANSMSAGNQSAPTTQQETTSRWKKLSFSYRMGSDADFIESLVGLVASSVMSEAEPEPLVSPVPVSKTTQREEVENFFISLLELQKLLPESENNRVISATDISMQLLNVFHFTELEDELDSVIGVAFENPETVVLDKNNYVTFFDGEATLVSLSGLTIINIVDSMVNWTMFYAWDQLKPNGLTFYRQRFGIGGYLISFGDESFKQNIPGLKFDLRRYKGEQSLDQIFEKGMSAIDGILDLCPASASDKPRVNSDTTTVSESFEPPAASELASSPAMNEAVNNLTNAFYELDNYQFDCSSKHFVYRYQLTDQLLEVIASILPDVGSNEIIGVLFEDPDSVYFDPASGEAGNFIGHANVVTYFSIATINNENNSISYVSEIPWEEAATENLTFWKDVGGEGYESICFGYEGRFYLFGGNWTVDETNSSLYVGAMTEGLNALTRIFGIVRGEIDLNETLEDELEDNIEEQADEDVDLSQVYHLDDGSVFEGIYDENGLPTGYGSYQWPSGDSYSGEFFQGQFFGNGTLTYAAGGSYSGTWDMGQKDGYGILTFADGSEYSGNFEDNLMQGEGTYTFANGDIYTGNFLNQRYEGIGTYTWTNGNEYTGEWSNGVKKGRGLMTYADGTTQEGLWDNDQFIG